MQTYTRRGVPASSMRTFCRFGSKRRLVATIEWLRLLPKAGPFPHEWQTFAMAAAVIAPGVRSSPRPRFALAVGCAARAIAMRATPTLTDLPERYRVSTR